MTPEERAANLAQVWIRKSDQPTAAHDFLVHLREAIAEEREATVKALDRVADNAHAGLPRNIWRKAARFVRARQ